MPWRPSFPWWEPVRSTAPRLPRRWKAPSRLGWPTAPACEIEESKRGKTEGQARKALVLARLRRNDPPPPNPGRPQAARRSGAKPWIESGGPVSTRCAEQS
ncbi:hypothetical protein Sp245p_34235 (plasmid) [Azospirillum baldaniorum]|uniref:Uncharacterized protein n=1 Tax=Azospirillum baldaniorum TaxID=1064539 RepID=A0A9P1NRX3_9PROT|nr:hypothetical protein Sp245p_34235 [Azospirillum baldaniorum]CCD03298.1 protein of unknown function [Azospirillum baldaniorum]